MSFINQDSARSNVFSRRFILDIGFLLLFIAQFFETEEALIPATAVVLRYTGLFLLIFGAYLIFLKKKFVILTNIGLLFLLVFTVEFTCYFLAGMPVWKKKDFSLPPLEKEHIANHIGLVPYADSVYHHVKVVKGDTVFDVNYSIDEYHKRTTPDHDSLNTEHAVFFGGSICYGHGLEDNQTLPYHFQSKSENRNSYNFGFKGYGTNHMIAQLQYHDLKEQIKEKKGTAYYIFFWDHIKRAIGSMDRYTAWLHSAPYYYLDGDNLVRDRVFKNGRSSASSFYEWVYQSGIVKYFGINFPTKLNQDHFELIAAMVLESKKEYLKDFPESDFYLVIYPSHPYYTKEEMVQFQSALKNKDVDFIDLTKFMKYEQKHTLGGDAHPNSETNMIVAEELINRLN